MTVMNFWLLKAGNLFSWINVTYWNNSMSICTVELVNGLVD